MSTQTRIKSRKKDQHNKKTPTSFAEEMGRYANEEDEEGEAMALDGRKHWEGGDG